MDEALSTKKRILEESQRLFADKGFEASSMRDIALAVGIKAASLYAHYQGKEEIFRSVLDSALAEWSGLVDGIFERSALCEDLASGLDLILGDFVASMAGTTAYRFWARVYVFPPPFLSAEDRERMVAMDRSFALRLGAFCAARLPRSARADIETLSASLSYFAMGVIMYAELMDEAALRDEIRRGVDFQLRAMGPGGNER
jgi:AcrR family transcriptional regulator